MASNCNTFVGISVNSGDSDYLDIYMEGAAMGWVAVGFTETPSMVWLSCMLYFTRVCLTWLIDFLFYT